MNGENKENRLCLAIIKLLIAEQYNLGFWVGDSWKDDATEEFSKLNWN